MKYKAIILASIAFLFISLPVHAKYFPGSGSIFSGGVSTSNYKGKDVFTAFVVRHGANGTDSVVAAGGDHRTGKKAMKEANKLANKMARQERKANNLEAKLRNKKERQEYNGLWQQFKKLFKKQGKGDSVMAGPDGQGDYRIGGIWTDPESGRDIYF